jgi:ribonucleoside-diphosphate reductase alpha chain
LISKIRKRDGRIVAFDREKIAFAIEKAFRSVNQYSKNSVRRVTDEVVKALEDSYRIRIPSVEEVQDLVEKTLISDALGDVAKSYILYRRKRAEIRESKRVIGVTDDLKLSLNATKVLERRYLKKDETGKVIETPRQLFRRVAHAIARIDREYDAKADVGKTEEIFFAMMSSLEFLPNSPTLMNAGTALGQLSACFVIPIEDTLPSIFDAVKATALIHKSGGGTGFSFSKLRPRGDIVKTSGGVASGPVSFMKIFDATTEEIKQGGRRRGANMGILDVSHPDIIEFITAKSRPDFLRNFNISVAVKDEFMENALRKRGTLNLVNPRNGKVTGTVSASEIFRLIVSKAWETGDPGLIFITEINRKNPTPKVGKIETTNPCGELPLLPYESCNLGSINLTKFVKNEREIDWVRLRSTIRNAVHFLDNVIDANKYPLAEVSKITRANRKIGLGVMGFAEILIMLNVRYDSEKGLQIARRVMSFIQRVSHEASRDLAKYRGSFPNFNNSIWPGEGYEHMRNATTTTIAPTGAISIIAGCSSGIEPLFAVSFVREVMERTKLFEVNSEFEKIAKDKGLYSQELLAKISESGSVRNLDLPNDLKEIFRTALDISPAWHIKIQAEFQKHVDNAVSKTINMTREATVDDVRKAYILAWRLKCKGITVYRYGSKPEQVLTIGSIEKADFDTRHVVADSEYAGGCAGSTCPY